MPVQGNGRAVTKPKPAKKGVGGISTFPAQGGSDASSTGGYGTGTPPVTPSPTLAPVDWSSLLGEYGMTPDMVNELNRIYSTTGDINAAIVLGQSYVRGTTWYAQTFPGIQAGINAGLFSDEQGYRTYGNQISQLYQQYYGRSATPGEISMYASTGKNASQVANQFQSSATQQNFNDPLKALFGPDELKALADEQSGIDSALGQKILGMANLYSQVGNLYQNFYGRPVTRDDLETLTKNGTDPAMVAQQFKQQENENAIDPAIKDLFTAQEIADMSLYAAGGITQNGQALANMANLATQLNAYYHTYTGAGVSRAEVEQAYTGGLTADQVGRQLAEKQFSGTLTDDVKALFTPEQLQQAAAQYTGASQTAEGAKTLALVQAAPGYTSLAKQYGDTLDLGKLTSMYDSGITATHYGQQLGGAAYIGANKGEIQQTAGSFGDTGQLTPDELKTLGEEQAGYDTPLGQILAKRLSLAQTRLQGAFQGVLAHPALSVTAGRLAGPQKPSDTAA